MFCFSFCTFFPFQFFSNTWSYLKSFLWDIQVSYFWFSWSYRLLHALSRWRAVGTEGDWSVQWHWQTSVWLCPTTSPSLRVCQIKRLWLSEPNCPDRDGWDSFAPVTNSIFPMQLSVMPCWATLGPCDSGQTVLCKSIIQRPPEELLLI